MGSFNTRCFVSNQTISSGNGVRILPIIQQSSYNTIEVHAPDNPTVISQAVGPSHSTCYSDAFWSMYSPMLQGEYDDYGRFKLYDTPENIKYLSLLFSKIHKESLVTKPGDNPYHEKGFDMRTLFSPKVTYTFAQLESIFEDVLELSSQYRLFINTRQGCVNMSFAVVSEIAFQETIRRHEKRFPLIHTFESKFKEFFDVMEQSDIQSFQGAQPGLFYLLEDAYQLASNAHRGITYHYRIDFFSENVKKIIQEYLHDRDINRLKSFFFEQYVPFYEFNAFTWTLEDFELKVQPMIYASQDYSNAVGQSYAQFIQTVSQQVTASIQNDDEFDDIDDDEIDFDSNSGLEA